MRHLYKFFILIFIFFPLYYDAAGQKNINDKCYTPPEKKEQALRASRCYLEQNQIEEAVEYLKRSLVIHQFNRELILLLAMAYSKDNNNLWTLKTLYEYSDICPEDREIWSWIIWFHILSGQLDRANDLIKIHKKNVNPLLRTRQILLSSCLFLFKNQNEKARIIFDEAMNESEIYSEDIILYDYLSRNLYPMWEGYARLTARAIMGYSTHPSISAEFGENAEKNGSPFAGIDMTVDLTPVSFSNYSPFVSLSGMIIRYTDEKAAGYSYFIPEIRIGMTFNFTDILVKPSYRSNAYLLNMPGPYEKESQLWFEKRYLEDTLWFYESHRFEADLYIPGDRSILAGFGRRIFSQVSRTGYEADLTFITPLFYYNNYVLTGAVSARYFKAELDYYDLTGATAIFLFQHSGFSGLLFNLNITGSYDYYPDFLNNTKRRDITYSIQPAVKKTLNDYLYIRIFYEYTGKDSSASTGYRNFDYSEQRINLEIGFKENFGYRKLSVVKPEGHIELPYNLETDSNKEVIDSIRYLLKHRENIQRSSTCVN